MKREREFKRKLVFHLGFRVDYFVAFFRKFLKFKLEAGRKELISKEKF